MSNETTVAYYQDDEADFLYACQGQMGYGGLLSIVKPVTGQSHWEWVQRGTDQWDALHQKIYRNFRATRIEESELPNLPPLPVADSEPPPYHDPASFPAAGYPHLSEFLNAEDKATTQFLAVLGEDTYETSSGDGEFHYLEYVAKTDQDAQDYISKQKQLPDGGYSRYHVRRLSLTLIDQVIHCDLQKNVYDHCKLEDALKYAETWAGSQRREGG